MAQTNWQNTKTIETIKYVYKRNKENWYVAVAKILEN